MGFRLIFAGLVFFCNPCINIVDLLPDFIGCILISAGLNKLADVEDRFYNARKYARIMIAVYVLKFLLALYVPVRWKDGLLPITFCFAVGEILLAVLFFTSLYGGIEYMANLHDGEKHLASVSRLTQFTVIFSVVKNALAFLPESFALEPTPELDLSYRRQRVFTLTDAKPYAILLCTVVTAVLGIYFLILTARYFRGLWQDNAFCGNLFEIYRLRVLSNPNRMNRRRFRRFFGLMLLGVLLFPDLIIDAVNVTPDIFSYLLMYAAVICLGGQIPRSLQLTFLPLAAVSLVSSFFKCLCDAGVNFIMDYESYMSLSFPPLENGSAIWIGLVLSLTEGVLFCLFVAFLIRHAASVYMSFCGKPFLTTGSLVFSILLAISSSLAYVAPLVKAKFYRDYINDTLVNAGSYAVSQRWELVQGYAVMAVILFTAGFIMYLISLYRKADMELAPPETL